MRCAHDGHTVNVCPSCYDDDYFTCPDCGGAYHNDHSEGDRGETVCDSCLERREERRQPRHINEYNADVTDYMQPTGKGPHYYGVELEVECDNPRNRSEQMQEAIKDFAILKQDGSLSYGFEIVTRPASLEEQVKGWNRVFKEMPSGLKSFSTETCGLHVHCSRAPMSQLQIAKLVSFINAAHNRQFVRRIAQRSSERWARYHAKQLKDAHKCNPQRYEAINLRNPNTIEFRIFKGTLKKESVFKAIEFCDLMVAWTAPGVCSLKESQSRVAMLNWMKPQRKRWPHLSAWLDARWYGKETRASKRCGFPVGDSVEGSEQ
jgi:hypothetical protein